MTTPIPNDHVIAIATREADQIDMVIWRDGDIYRAQPRAGEKRDNYPSWPDDDYWIHVKTNHRYSRRAVVDIQGVPYWYYIGTNYHDGWLRPVSEWEEDVGGHTRFIHDLRPQFSLATVRTFMDAGRYNVAVAGGQLNNFLDEARKTGGVDMDPDFQRGHVWKPKNQTLFMEHLLRKGEHGRTIIWNDPSYGKRVADSDLKDGLVIVDGKQRMTAVLSFLDDKVPVFGGHVFSQFDRHSRMQVLAPTGLLRMQMNIVGLQYRRELLQLYIELNEGAVAHDPSEIARVRNLLEKEEA